MAGKGTGGKGGGKGGGADHSAVTGKFVTSSYAKSHPSTTVHVTNKPSGGGGKKGK